MKNLLIIFCAALALWGCQTDGAAGDETMQPPKQVQLIFPLENSACNEGRDITPTESTISFEWQALENAADYRLSLRNLFTDEVNTFTTTGDTLAVTLQRATAYAWYVEARPIGLDSITPSAIWKFYNAGDGLLAYAPFPAEILSPRMAEVVTAIGGKITLQWSGGDVDDDIIGYDVFFGSVTPPPLFSSDLPEQELADVSVASDSIYYWQVVTKDAFGNQSVTGISQFKVIE